jgi:hypothetical protein
MSNSTDFPWRFGRRVAIGQDLRLAAVELTGGDGGPIQVEPQIDFSRLTQDERGLMRQLLESVQARLGGGAVGGLHALPSADEDLEDAA